jgi:MFS family permease
MLKENDSRRRLREHVDEHQRSVLEQLGPLTTSALRVHLAAHMAKLEEGAGRRASFSASVVDPPPSPVGMQRTKSIVSSALSPAGCESASNWMLLSSAVSTIGMNLTMTPTTEVWNQHFAGDFTAQARMMTNLGLVSSVVGFVLKPVLASLTDTFGRKPLMFSSPVANTLLTGGMVLSSRSRWTTFLAIRYCCSPLTYEAQMLARQAAMGDMFSNDSKRLGRHLARMSMIWPVSSIFCPIISGYLTACFGLRLPLVIATIMYAFNLFIVVPRIPETLPRDQRKPFVLGMGSSPLTAFKLFTKGKWLRRISFLQLLDSMSGQEVCWNLSELSIALRQLVLVQAALGCSRTPLCSGMM